MVGVDHQGAVAAACQGDAGKEIVGIMGGGNDDTRPHSRDPYAAEPPAEADPGKRPRRGPFEAPGIEETHTLEPLRMEAIRPSGHCDPHPADVGAAGGPLHHMQVTTAEGRQIPAVVDEHGRPGSVHHGSTVWMVTSSSGSMSPPRIASVTASSR